MTKKYSESTTPPQRAILSLVESRILCQNYFSQIAKLGEYIANHVAKLQQVESISQSIEEFVTRTVFDGSIESNLRRGQSPGG